MDTIAVKARKPAMKRLGLLERLAQGPVICAEGYVFELERRGYLQAGAYVPEVVLEHPEAVEALHREFVNAGSDVVEALTYYAHRAKMKMVGREADAPELNRQALRIARRVARSTGTLMAGNICNTHIYDPEDAKTIKAVRRMFDEQVEWAREGGADFIIGETYAFAGEALLATEAIRKSGLPAVITLAVHQHGMMRDGGSVVDACRRLEEAGADVVGMNCTRGPATMLPMLKEIRAAVTCHVAALPVPYRTTSEQPTFQSLRDPNCDCVPDDRPFPTALDPFVCNRYEIAQFGKTAYAMGVRYLGVCCGAGPHHVRALAESLGRSTVASRYSADMSKHAYFGSDKRLKQKNLEYRHKV
ncbi:MAG TPA: homocysteine S-methyltransferase family protein [Casimicrobiaceae bacterium]|nr:homocysteine S-methyltransferase family protein [Casimicrobiaceae bacterium]